jgi:hypothetical protein
MAAQLVVLLSVLALSIRKRQCVEARLEANAGHPAGMRLRDRRAQYERVNRADDIAPSAIALYP